MKKNKRTGGKFYSDQVLNRYQLRVVGEMIKFQTYDGPIIVEVRPVVGNTLISIAAPRILEPKFFRVEYRLPDGRPAVLREIMEPSRANGSSKGTDAAA